MQKLCFCSPPSTTVFNQIFSNLVCAQVEVVRTPLICFRFLFTFPEVLLAGSKSLWNAERTKFENIWLKTVVLRGLQKQRFCIRSSRASKDFWQVLYIHHYSRTLFLQDSLIEILSLFPINLHKVITNFQLEKKNNPTLS